MCRRPLLIPILAALLITGAGVTNAQIILNGSFEEGSGSDIQDWGHSGSLFIVDSEIFAPIPDGSQIMGFNGGEQPPNGVLSQAFPTAPGQTYTVTFDFGATSSVTQQGTPQSLRVEATSVHLLGAIDVSDLASRPISYERYNFDFVADRATTLLSFSDTSVQTGSVDGALDRVIVTGPLVPRFDIVDLSVQYSLPSTLSGPVSFGLSSLPDTFAATFSLQGFSSAANIVAGLSDVATVSIRLGDGLWTELTSFSLVTDSTGEVTTLSYATTAINTPTVVAEPILNSSFSATISGTDIASGQDLEYDYAASTQTLTVQSVPAVPALQPIALLLLVSVLGAGGLAFVRRAH